MSYPHQNYSFACDSNGILVNIFTARRNEKYFCPICGTQMTPHMGKIRRWHFVHKNTSNCSYESYLHNLAKRRIKQAFLDSAQFMLSYKACAVCSISCPYLNSKKCYGEKLVKFDLRQFYDKCELEVSYKQFRADLLLSSSISKNRPPILMEIMVTHECTQEKINDGVRIIEIPIFSESQIDEIVENCSLFGLRNKSYSSNTTNKDLSILYNFDKEEKFDPRDSFDEVSDLYYRKDTIVFLLYRNGRFRTFDCSCFEVGKMIPNDVHYFISNIAIPFKEIFQGFSKRGVKVRNCFLCKFSKKYYYNNERICVLYKKLGLPRKPSPTVALTCDHYMEDIDTSENYVESQSDADYQYVGLNFKSYYHICKDIL